MRIITTCFLLLFTSSLFAQQRAYFDPAQAYNRLLIEKNDGTYQTINNYKVIGTSLLYGEKNRGSLFGPGESAEVQVTYDTYKQLVNFYPASTSKGLVKEPGTLDSFLIKKNAEAMLENDIVFLYGSQLGSKDKAYFQVVQRGPKYTLYKKYSAELAIVTENIVQAELRQFNINVDYYYTDSTGKNLKKLKVNARSITKEFETVDLTSAIDADLLVTEREQQLVKIFDVLNQ